MNLLFAIALTIFVTSSAAGQSPGTAAFEWFEISGTGADGRTLAQREDFSDDELGPGWTVPDAKGDNAVSGSAKVSGGHLLIEGNRHPLSASVDFQFPARRRDTASLRSATELDYSKLENGDVAGLVLFSDGEHWLSIQVERIAPADLVAVRLRESDRDPPAGRLIATIGLPAAANGRVRLEIAVLQGTYTLGFATGPGPLQHLATLRDWSRANQTDMMIGPFAIDGAPRLR